LESAGTGDAVPVNTVKSTKVGVDGKATTAGLTPKAVKSTEVDTDGNAQSETAESALPPANLAQEDSAEPAPTEPADVAIPEAKPVDTAAAEAEPVQAAPAEPKPAETQATEAKPTEAKPEVVATANVEPTAVAPGAWSVQIASQPSAESAKSTYQDLASRFGSVIGGRGVNIVKAEIDGKGTYWRVRVPAKSRNDAVKLCSDYKAAGGNCFVSK
jgi:cell division protein FtsN